MGDEDIKVRDNWRWGAKLASSKAGFKCDEAHLLRPSRVTIPTSMKTASPASKSRYISLSISQSQVYALPNKLFVTGGFTYKQWLDFFLGIPFYQKDWTGFVEKLYNIAFIRFFSFHFFCFMNLQIFIL